MHRYQRPRGHRGKASAMMPDLTYPLFDAEMYFLAVCTYDADHHLLIDLGGDRIEAILPTLDDARRIACDRWLVKRVVDKNTRDGQRAWGLHIPDCRLLPHTGGHRYRRLYRHPRPSPLTVP